MEEDQEGVAEHFLSDYLISLLGPFSVLGRSFVVSHMVDQRVPGKLMDVFYLLDGTIYMYQSIHVLQIF